MKKNILLVLLIILFVSSFVEASSSYNEKIVDEYHHQLEDSNAFFFTDIDKQRENFIHNAPYTSLYLYVDEEDFWYIMNKWDNERDLPVQWFLMGASDEKTNSLSSFFGSSVSSFTPFKGTLKLRGVNALTCGKKWFRIESDTLDIKLKSMCWSVYSLEDYLYSELLEADKKNTQKLLMNYPHQLKKVYVNGKFYGIFLSVPKLNSEFLEHNGIENPSHDNNCVFKVYKDFDVDSPLMWTMVLRDSYTAKQQLLGSVELNYGDTEMCLQKLHDLVKIVNQANPTIDDLKELLVLPSVLYWWLANISSRNYVSFSHNYLLIYEKWKFHIGNWDAQEFNGCKKTDPYSFEKYYSDSYDPAHRNRIFDHVLRWYVENNKEDVFVMQKKVVNTLCHAPVYKKVLHNDLKYVIFDRFIWNLWHMRTIDYFRNDYVALLEEAYKKKIGFAEFFKKFYNWFDEYFWLQ